MDAFLPPELAAGSGDGPAAGAVSVETLLAHADSDSDSDSGLADDDLGGVGSVAPPLYQVVNFAAATSAGFERMSGVRGERFYRRDGNPSQARLERLVAAVEGAEAALATASGMGALATTLLALVGAGQHVVAQRSMYGGTLSLLRELAPRWGIEASLVDQTDVGMFERAVRTNTRLIMLETPSNPLLRLTDIAPVAALARAHGIHTLADNTVATPINTRPLELGVDLVMHSVTKHLSGHADVLAGIVVGRAELIDRIWRTHVALGAVISPMDAWLALRGLRTLGMRMHRQNETALAVARFLDNHPAVGRVHYPGLPSHPQHDLATRQMTGFGGLLSFELPAGADAAERLIDSCALPVRSPSLGGFRTTVVRPAAMWKQRLDTTQLAAAGVPAGLVRYAVGLESAADLIADLTRALACVEPAAT